MKGGCGLTSKTKKNPHSYMRKIKILYIITSFKQSGPINQLFYIIKNLDRTVFEPYLLMTSEKGNDATIEQKYRELLKVGTLFISKLHIMLGGYNNIKGTIERIDPAIIHTLGLFPDYLVERIGYKNHILTLRDYCYIGHKDKYGKVLGYIMIKMQEYVMSHCENIITCSKSLSDLYYKKNNTRFPYIRNGVDINSFYRVSKEEKSALRDKMAINSNERVFIYSGQFVDRKNQMELVEALEMVYEPNIKVFLLGDGPEFNNVEAKASADERIVFLGKVHNVHDYLAASDIYVSTSKSEGMPNGVLEAMATGLPVLLSDIDQHEELFSVNSGIGMKYILHNKRDLANKIIDMYNCKVLESMGENAYQTCIDSFTDKCMSMQYQDYYKRIAGVQV